ncbi:MAG: hypothetical protein ACRYG5_17120 [Janthinobacterium lividum]
MAAPISLQSISLGVPGIDSAVGKVRAALGPAQSEQLGGFSYSREYPDPAKPSFTTTQTVRYSVQTGAAGAARVVTAIEMSQVTSN